MPKPGDFGLTTIPGIPGAFVYFGQWFIGDASRWTHAFIVLDEHLVMEARPGGAAIRPLSLYEDQPILYSDLDLDPETRQCITANALSLWGTPYSFLDYAALALDKIGIRADCIKGYIASSGHMICSQFVDEVYRRSGVPLFHDGRLSQEVTPGDLARLLE